jgi:hypothetical protein
MSVSKEFWGLLKLEQTFLIILNSDRAVGSSFGVGYDWDRKKIKFGLPRICSLFSFASLLCEVQIAIVAPLDHG